MSNEAPRAHPLLIVVSAPSGAGKTTLCRRLLADDARMVYSVSCTTRAPRGDERDGAAYFFLTPGEFARRRDAGEFLESALVHGHWYGTPRRHVVATLASGRDVLLDIDVQGAAQVRETLRAALPEDPLRAAYVDVFIAPPSLAELRRRLETRGQDAPEVIERRLRQADQELARAAEYRHTIVNDRLETAYAELRRILDGERGRRAAGRAAGL